jgi:integrase/recombinase XerD
MLGRQAKTLSPAALNRVLARVRQNDHGHEHHLRDLVIVLLSVRAGLRACEIANLTWGMVQTPHGQIGTIIEVRGSIAKNGTGRRVPMHVELAAALRQLQGATPAPDREASRPVIRSLKGGAMRPNSIVNWFRALYRELELEGCSSHSGRRTFITNAARKAHRAGASIRDVQMLAGHASIETTQRYIDGDTDAQRKLVALI